MEMWDKSRGFKRPLLPKQINYFTSRLKMKCWPLHGPIVARPHRQRQPGGIFSAARQQLGLEFRNMCGWRLNPQILRVFFFCFLFFSELCLGHWHSCWLMSVNCTSPRDIPHRSSSTGYRVTLKCWCLLWSLNRLATLPQLTNYVHHSWSGRVFWRQQCPSDVGRTRCHGRTSPTSSSCTATQWCTALFCQEIPSNLLLPVWQRLVQLLKETPSTSSPPVLKF